MTAVSAGEPVDERWWRRPRPPLTGFLAVESQWPFYPAGKVVAFMGLGIACLWGIGFSTEVRPWWGRTIGVVVAVASFVGIVVLAAYLRRPVSEELVYDDAEAWAHELARHGRVDLGVRTVPAVLAITLCGAFVALGGVLVVAGDTLVVRVLGVVCFGVFLLLGLLPHLEFATGRGHGLRVDTRGITIARWVPLHIPWSEVHRVHTVWRIQAVVRTTDRFAADYRASRPLLLRLTGGGPGLFGSDEFAIPGTIAANPDALTAWLTYEARQRQGERTG